MKKAISTNGAPAAIGPYSQAIDCGEFVFTSGQLGLDPATGKLADGGVQAQATQAMKNIQAVLTAAGLTLDNVVKTTVLLTNIADFAACHELVLFVAGRKSSNGRVLFAECSRVNANSHQIESQDEIRREWLDGIQSVGICGATSTPKWLMEQCAKKVEQLFKF